MLLEGLIDDENAYVTQNNRHWTTYRDVATVAQTAYLGYGARWTESKEQTVLSGKQDEILNNAREFYEAIAEAFPEIDDVFTGTIEPSELRGGGSRTSRLLHYHQGPRQRLARPEVRVPPGGRRRPDRRQGCR